MLQVFGTAIEPIVSSGTCSILALRLAEASKSSSYVSSRSTSSLAKACCRACVCVLGWRGIPYVGEVTSTLEKPEERRWSKSRSVGGDKHLGE